ncbi:MAG: tRNA (N6-isopentenyl adenosine(37)-C2)-methylthiotransferase MiaB [Christensenellaceae bacterium]|nr:tRNA (N6-isopentenyl adenosine(37)-C2)-methylthiotransferase MiaB [Christensenellaceae bacterium]
MEKGLRYYIETYGCQMNAHDSERLAGILTSVGFEPAASEEEADLILFNTCCVRENAELKIFGNVGALKKKKREKPELIIGVCGCMMQQEEVAERLAKTFPFVNIVFGTHNMVTLPGMLYKAIFEKKRTLAVSDQEDVPGSIEARREAPPLFSVNIMQGCDNFCSYCIVPYVRGRERSRASEDIVKEVTEQVKKGYKEVMLLGQNVNSYGKGLPEETDFAGLLEKIATTTGVERIRFMTSHPKDVSDRLLAVMAKYDNICKQLHLPVQSGSTRVLKEMNRKYTREDYLALIERVRRALPGVFLSTDIIVGFPGETREEFEETLSLVKEVGFDAAYTFVYSIRSGTRAARMEDQIPEEEKQRRIVQLVALQGQLTYESNLRNEGKIERVLIEGTSKRDEGHICGRTDGGKMVNLAGEESLVGQFVQVEITKAKKTTLYGRRIEE